MRRSGGKRPRRILKVLCLCGVLALGAADVCASGNTGSAGGLETAENVLPGGEFSFWGTGTADSGEEEEAGGAAEEKGDETFAAQEKVPDTTGAPKVTEAPDVTKAPSIPGQESTAASTPAPEKKAGEPQTEEGGEGSQAVKKAEGPQTEKDGEGARTEKKAEESQTEKSAAVPRAEAPDGTSAGTAVSAEQNTGSQKREEQARPVGEADAFSAGRKKSGGNASVKSEASAETAPGDTVEMPLTEQVSAEENPDPSPEEQRVEQQEPAPDDVPDSRDTSRDFCAALNGIVCRCLAAERIWRPLLLWGIRPLTPSPVPRGSSCLWLEPASGEETARPDYAPLFRLSGSARPLILSCRINGREAAWSWEEEGLSVRGAGLREGTNRIRIWLRCDGAERPEEITWRLRLPVRTAPEPEAAGTVRTDMPRGLWGLAEGLLRKMRGAF